MSDEYRDAKLSEVAEGIAEDLRLLAYLHGGELDEESLSQLRAGRFCDLLALELSDPLVDQASEVIDETLMGIDDNADVLDELAADYANIYLTHRLKVSPFESPWFDEDRLVNGKPMFEVRGWYREYGLEVEDWRLVSDDHLSMQLLFIAHLILLPEPQWAEAGRFMDAHLLRWLQPFATAVAQRAATPFYTGLAMLTYAYIERVRRVIEKVSGESRNVAKESVDIQAR